MNESNPPAGLGHRLAAMFYDSLLIFAIGCAVSASAIGIRVALHGEEEIRRHIGAAAGGPVLQLALVLAWAGFYCWFWTRNGQTLGMQAWRLRVETLDGRLVDYRTALLRLAGAFVSFASLGLGYWWLLFDAEHRAWHDRWSATLVVRLPAK